MLPPVRTYRHRPEVRLPPQGPARDNPAGQKGNNLSTAAVVVPRPEAGRPPCSPCPNWTRKSQTAALSVL